MVVPLLPNVSSLVIITGPSKGFGRALVLQLAKFFATPSIFVLIGRSQEALVKVSEKIKAINPNHVVELVLLTFGQRDFAEQVRIAVDYCSSLENIETQTVLIHNHGSFLSQYAVDLSTVTEEESEDIGSYLDVNLVHVAEFNGLLIKELEKKWRSLGNRFFVVNISSLAASHPFPSWAPYCMAKAGRAMLFSCLAADRPNLNVLQYCPGPLLTEMSCEVQLNTKDENLKKESETWNLIEPAESADKLIKLLSTGTYTSGQSIDFFDMP